MEEVGIDISDQKPKVLESDAVEASDVVITMGCGGACSFFPGVRYLGWTLKAASGRQVNRLDPRHSEHRLME